MHLFNSVCLAKVAWRFMAQPEALWSRVFKVKYGNGLKGLASFQSKHVQSLTWKGILSTKSIIRQGIRNAIQNGHDTLFWQDSWLLDEPLCLISRREIPISDINCTVASYWNGDDWDYDRLVGLLPSNVAQQLQAVILRNEENVKDALVWGISASGLFSIKSAYELVTMDR